MRWIIKYSFKISTLIFVVYILLITVLKSVVFVEADLPIGLMIASYCIFGFWVGVMLMGFLWRVSHKSGAFDSQKRPQQVDSRRRRGGDVL